MRKSSGLIHALARCSTCGKEFIAKNAQGLAAQHAAKYGHEVTGEIVIGFHYGNGGQNKGNEGGK